jgi:hypothetical protein
VAAGQPARAHLIWQSAFAKPISQSLDLTRNDLTGNDLDGRNLTEARVTTTTITEAPPVPMSRIWRTIRDFILWSYERGTLQYDVMVTLILLFVFLSPYWIDFHDKPVERNPHPIGVVVTPEPGGGFIYQIEGSAVSATTDDAKVRQELLRIVEPIAGEVSVTRYEVLRDRQGRVLTYKVWVQKE